MKVYSRRRRGAFETGPELKDKGGREGTIYAPPGEPHTIVKVFKQPAAHDREAKLGELAQHPPHNPPTHGFRRFAWPRELLYDAGGQFLGYAMHRVPDGKPVDAFADPHGSGFREREFRVGLARELAALVEDIHCHQLDIVIGDISASNFLINAKGQVALIDIDSAQITTPRGRTYLCPTHSIGYTAPELMGVDLGKTPRRQEHDWFGLAVLIYQLLCDGWHPFAARDPRALDERIRAGDCPQIRGGAAVPPDAPRIETLPDELRELFVAAFVDGHGKPEFRPTPAEWGEALKRKSNVNVKVLCPQAPTVAAPVCLPTAPAAPWSGRRAVVAFGGVALLSTAAGFFGTGWLFGGDEGEIVNAASVSRPEAVAALPPGPKHNRETPWLERRIEEGRGDPLCFERALGLGRQP